VKGVGTALAPGTGLIGKGIGHGTLKGVEAIGAGAKKGAVATVHGVEKVGKGISDLILAMEFELLEAMAQRQLNMMAVSDYSNNRVKIMDKKGSLLHSFPLQLPRGIAIIPLILLYTNSVRMNTKMQMVSTTNIHSDLPHFVTLLDHLWSNITPSLTQIVYIQCNMTIDRVYESPRFRYVPQQGNATFNTDAPVIRGAWIIILHAPIGDCKNGRSNITTEIDSNMTRIFRQLELTAARIR